MTLEEYEQRVRERLQEVADSEKDHVEGIGTDRWFAAAKEMLQERDIHWYIVDPYERGYSVRHCAMDIMLRAECWGDDMEEWCMGMIQDLRDRYEVK